MPYDLKYYLRKIVGPLYIASSAGLLACASSPHNQATSISSVGGYRLNINLDVIKQLQRLSIDTRVLENDLYAEMFVEKKVVVSRDSIYSSVWFHVKLPSGEIFTFSNYLPLNEPDKSVDVAYLYPKEPKKDKKGNYKPSRQFEKNPKSSKYNSKDPTLEEVANFFYDFIIRTRGKSKASTIQL